MICVAFYKEIKYNIGINVSEKTDEVGEIHGGELVRENGNAEYGK